MTMPLPCVNCLEPYQPLRSTSKFCSSNCRQQWHRKQKKIPGTEANATAAIKAEISSVYKIVHTFTEKFSLKDLALADTGPLEDALEELTALFNCEMCDERRADGWDNIELCRRCEIQTFELVCWQCEKRRPSVNSDDRLCRQCMS